VLIKVDARRVRPLREKIEMTFKASEIPFESYWRYLREETPGVSLFSFPRVTVFASSKAEADEIAGPDAHDGVLAVDTGLDSAEASSRLGIWGRPDLDAKMRRGD
jgi:hypothetical protein